MASGSARVSLTYDELIKLRDLQGSAWGHQSKAYAKLAHAINKIKEERREQNAPANHTR